MNSSLKYAIQIAVIALLVGSIMYFTVMAILIRDVEESLIHFAEQGAKTVNTFLNGHISQLKSISANSIVNNSSLPVKQRLSELKEQLKLDSYLRLSLADLQGSSMTTEGVRINIADREYFQKAVRGESNISGPLVSRVDGTMVIVFAVPVIEDGKITGVLYATYDADVLSRMTDEIKLNHKGNSFIIDRNGYTIAHDQRSLVYGGNNDIINSRTQPELAQLVELEKKMLAGQSGSGLYVYHGVVKYMGFSPIGNTGWSIAVASPRSEVLRLINIVFVILMISFLIVIAVVSILFLRSRRLEMDLSRQQVSSSRAADVTNLIMFTINQDGDIVKKNKYADKLLDHFSHGARGQVTNIYELLSVHEGEKFKEVLVTTLLQNSSSTFELAMKRSGYEPLYLYCSMTGDRESGETFEILGLDITDRVESQNRLQDSYDELHNVYNELAEKEEGLRKNYNEMKRMQDMLEELAFTDSLTGLPNRTSFYNEAMKDFEKSTDDNKMAFLSMDIDNFKYVNDTFSHHVGDLVLTEAGNRLKAISTGDVFVARLEGDTFILILKHFSTFTELERKINALMNTFNEPFEAEGNHFHFTVSCGVSIYPQHASTVEGLLKSADMALFHAKKEGKRKYIIFDESMNYEFIQRMTMENGLRRALSNNEFQLYYQPHYKLDSGRISGFEALIRWISPLHGMILPLKFINIAEETGLIVPIGRWVLTTACRFIKKLNEITGRKLEIAVNVSVVQLLQADFVSMVHDVLKETHLDPKLLELELTESRLMEEIDLCMQRLTELRGLGVGISIDDFGKGFSSLSYLKELPINTLKIDKSFIDDIRKDENSMVESIIHIGHQRGLAVIAEGVEKKEQMEYLAMHKCDKVQGYLYSKPVPESDAANLLAENTQIYTGRRPQ